MLCFASKNVSFCFQFFSFASKRNEINIFLLCFASKRNEINVFSLLFTSLGIDLKKIPTLIFVFVSLLIFPEFHFILFRFEVFPSFSFCFLFIVFSLHFRCENKQKTLFSNWSDKISLPFRFASKQKWWQFSLLFCLFFALFYFLFASDFYDSYWCEKSE